MNWGEDFSMPFKSCLGVIQEGVLSPQLFNEFLSDLGDYLDPECGVKLDRKLLLYLIFADDLILFLHSAKGLQKQLNCLYKYCAKWHLIVSLLKTKVVIYNSTYALRNCALKYGDEVIEIVNTYKYLGVWCSNKNKLFFENSAYFSNKASKAIFVIRDYSSETLGKLTPRLALKTFNRNSGNGANTIEVF